MTRCTLAFYLDSDSACPDCGHGPRWHLPNYGCTRMVEGWCPCSRVYDVPRHYHVHSVMPGYLCECDSHYPYDARGRDAALRAERDAWRDWCEQGREFGAGDDRISGSIRSGRFDITGGIAFWRAVESWECTERECLKGTE